MKPNTANSVARTVQILSKYPPQGSKPALFNAAGLSLNQVVKPDGKRKAPMVVGAVCIHWRRIQVTIGGDCCDEV